MVHVANNYPFVCPFCIKLSLSLIAANLRSEISHLRAHIIKLENSFKSSNLPASTHSLSVSSQCLDYSLSQFLEHSSPSSDYPTSVLPLIHLSSCLLMILFILQMLYPLPLAVIPLFMSLVINSNASSFLSLHLCPLPKSFYYQFLQNHLCYLRLYFCLLSNLDHLILKLSFHFLFINHCCNFPPFLIIHLYIFPLFTK